VRLPDSAHTSRPWRIHELAHDFRLEDVWGLPTPGGAEDFLRAVELIASLDLVQSPDRVVRSLAAIRLKLGELLRWDDPAAGLGSRVPSLRERLPEDLRQVPAGPDFEELPASPVYLLDDEWAVEVANHTVHALLHLGWVPDGAGAYRSQLAVLTKPNGWLGTAYIAAIQPFRYLFVYPAMMRQIALEWRDSSRG
jgi:hypothetical protein